MSNSQEKKRVSEEQHETGTEILQAILEQLGSDSRDIQMSIITTADGLNMAAWGDVRDVDSIGARSAELLVFGQKTAAEFERGEAEQIILKGTNGFLIIMPAGPKAVIAVMTRPDVNLGMVFLDLESAARQVMSALS